MVCTVSFKIVDSTGAAIPNAIFFLQAFKPISAGSEATAFNVAERIEADGSGEGTIDLFPGRYTGAAAIGTILQGAKDRRFEFRVPEGVAAAELQDLIDAPAVAPGEILAIGDWAAALGNAQVYSSVVAGMGDTDDGDYFAVVVQAQGPQVALWQNVDSEPVSVALQFEVIA